MDISDQEYIDAIINGDPGILRQMYQTFLPKIERFITSKGGSKDDAMDIFQDAIMVIYGKAKQKNFNLTSSFYTYLYGICRNLWGNKLQKKSRTEVTLNEDIKYNQQVEGVDALMEEQEEYQLFWSSFKKLGADCQKVLQLFFEKTKMEKIVEIMGYSSVGYAKKRKFQCKERLVKLIKDDDRFQELSL